MRPASSGIVTGGSSRLPARTNCENPGADARVNEADRMTHPTCLAKAVGRTHYDYTRYVNRPRGRSGHLWQNRFISCPQATTTTRRSCATSSAIGYGRRSCGRRSAIHGRVRPPTSAVRTPPTCSIFRSGDFSETGCLVRPRDPAALEVADSERRRAQPSESRPIGPTKIGLDRPRACPVIQAPLLMSIDAVDSYRQRIKKDSPVPDLVVLKYYTSHTVNED